MALLDREVVLERPRVGLRRLERRYGVYRRLKGGGRAFGPSSEASYCCAAISSCRSDDGTSLFTSLFTLLRGGTEREAERDGAEPMTRAPGSGLRAHSEEKGDAEREEDADWEEDVVEALLDTHC